MKRFQQIFEDTSGSKAILFDMEMKTYRVGNSESNELEYVSSEWHDDIRGAIKQLYTMGYEIKGIRESTL